MLLYFTFYFPDVTLDFSYLYTFASWTNLNLNLNLKLSRNLGFWFFFYKMRTFLKPMTTNLLGVQVTDGFKPGLIESNHMLTLASVFSRYAEGLAIILNCYHC